VVQQPAPANLIPGGLFDETLLTKFAIDKFADYQPLNRQVEQAAAGAVDDLRESIDGSNGSPPDRCALGGLATAQQLVCG
jgi:transposase